MKRQRSSKTRSIGCHWSLIWITCLTLMLSTGQAVAVNVIYMDDFNVTPPNDGRFVNADNAGWIGESKGIRITPNQDISVFDANDPLFEPINILFWSPKTHDINLYSEEIGSQSVPVRALFNITWESRNSFDTSDNTCAEVAALLDKNRMRVAMKIDGTWYISEDTYNTTSATTFNTDRCDANSFETHVHMFDGTEKYLKYDIGIASAGRLFDTAKTLSDHGVLDGDTVDAVGIFLDGAVPGNVDIAGNIRIDNYVVEAAPSDLNQDGCINLSDYFSLAPCYGKTPSFTGCENADINGDNIIDGLDISSLVSDPAITFTQTCP